MADKLCVAVIGNRNSGKSTTWQQLFGGKVKGGYHELQLYYGDYAKVFLVGSSPQEQKTPINQLLGAKRPRIVLCAIQYSFDAHETLTFFSDNGYQIFAHWLNPGYKDTRSGSQRDRYRSSFRELPRRNSRWEDISVQTSTEYQRFRLRLGNET